jgi:coniferyl-aldehyde dehydrogenase
MTAATAGLEALLSQQRSAFLAEGCASARVRIDRLRRALDLLVTHEREICEALAQDFGRRPAALTRFTDILPAVLALKHAQRHVRRWMRPEHCSPGWPLNMPGAKAHIVHQPLGVVGVISPWNFPVNLTFGPLAGVLAAGNRCLIKPSEVTPATAELLRALLAKSFDLEEVAVVTGGKEIAEAFARLPFDHLVFTGSTAIGERVMTAAAAHLVPVTLELGGKCPTVVGRSASLKRAVDRILLGKLANAGQMCLAPDYVFVPRKSAGAFVELAQRWVRSVYPDLCTNPDYTTIVSESHAHRIEALLADARAKGARTITLTDAADRPAPTPRLIAPMLLLDTTDDMAVMREEIFGPLLPVLAYDRIETVIADINRRPRPLALYYFGTDYAEERELLARTTSGGVTVNDVAIHFLAQDLPFGGVGASGMGEYHGWHGFRRFSHARAVFHQTSFDVAGLVGLRPPYGDRVRRALNMLIRR